MEKRIRPYILNPEPAFRGNGTVGPGPRVKASRALAGLFRVFPAGARFAGGIGLGLLLAVVFFFEGCAPRVVVHQDANTVAIWDLEDLNGGDSPYPDLEAFLSAKVIETFKQSGRYGVVERERLLLALDELKLGTNDLVDETTRLRLGRMVKARYMVFGGYFVVDTTLRLDLRLVEVETGAVIRASTEEGSAAGLAGWLKAAERAARDLL